MAAAAPIQPLGWELPYATGAALQRQKEKRKKKKKISQEHYFSKLFSFCASVPITIKGGEVYIVPHAVAETMPQVIHLKLSHNV